MKHDESAPAAAVERSISRTALLLLPMQIVFRAGEALLPILIAFWFGRSPSTDLYFLGSAFFVFAGSMLAAAFQDSALVPILAELRATNPKDVPRVAGSLFSHAMVYGSGFAAAAGGLALAWTYAHHDQAIFAIARSMVLPFSLWIIALVARSFFAGLLNASGQYFVQPVASAAGMTASIALIAIGHSALGILVVPLGALVNETLAATILAYFAIGKSGLSLVLSLARPEPVRRFWKLVAAAVAGATITRINPMVDQIMARFVDVEGGGTVLRLASDVASVPTSLAQAALFSVLLSQLSRDAAGGSFDRFEQTLRRSLFSTCAILTVAAGAMAMIRLPLLRLALLHGQMDEAGIEKVADILPYALLGVAPFGAVLILALAHVALQNNRIMIALGILNTALNFAFDWALLKPFGLLGIALATSLMHLVIALVFWHLLTMRLRELRAVVPHPVGPRP